jgi:hypothetical protein
MAHPLAGFLENDFFRPPVAGDLAFRTGGGVHSFLAPTNPTPLGLDSKKNIHYRRERCFLLGLQIIKRD